MIGIHIFYWFGCARFYVSHPRDVLLYADDNAFLHLDAQFKSNPNAVADRTAKDMVDFTPVIMAVT